MPRSIRSGPIPYTGRVLEGLARIGESTNDTTLVEDCDRFVRLAAANGVDVELHSLAGEWHSEAEPVYSGEPWAPNKLVGQIIGRLNVKIRVFFHVRGGHAVTPLAMHLEDAVRQEDDILARLRACLRGDEKVWIDREPYIFVLLLRS